MAKLLYLNDERHEYQLDGEVLPSVSEITRFISREVYGEVTQFILERAADRGTRVHKATEALDKYGSVDADEDILPYLQAYVNFRKEHSAEWEKIEHSAFHPERRYAGTIDRVGIVDGEKLIVDIKTTSTVQKVSVTAQLTLYRMMLEANGESVDGIAVLHLKNDGKYSFQKLEDGTALAEACLVLHDALKKKKRKKKEKEDADNDK